MTSVKEELPLRRLDVVVVGAGFAGLYAIHLMRKIGVKVHAFEAGSGVGGTWFWNRYPGARCDIESLEYSYSFCDELQQEWKWSERYAAQPEILEYLNHVADRFSLRSDVTLNTRIISASFDDGLDEWRLLTDTGEQVQAKFCIMATGCLSSAQMPELKGISDFAGDIYHTGSWPHHPVDFSGKRVGILGTGSSGIQLIPKVAEQAGSVFVFQRTPAYTVPAANRPMDDAAAADVKERYAELRQAARYSPSGSFVTRMATESALGKSQHERTQRFAERWEQGGISFMAAFNDLRTNLDANLTAAEFVREKIRASVKDPSVAEVLCPTFPIGAKRLCADTGYYQTYNRSNVKLVDLSSEPVVQVTATGMRTTQAEYPLDAIVFATGFDAMTGALRRIDIRGVGGVTLRDVWADGPSTYLGLMVAQFPNLFLVTGPGSPSVLSNMIVSIEQHVEWIADCIAHLRRQGVARIEADHDAQARWVRHVNEVADLTILPNANSWYVGANIPGKPRVFMPYVGGVDVYRRRCDEVAAAGYAGFTLSDSSGDK